MIKSECWTGNNMPPTKVKKVEMLWKVILHTIKSIYKSTIIRNCEIFRKINCKFIFGEIIDPQTSWESDLTTQRGLKKSRLGQDIEGQEYQAKDLGEYEAI